METVWRSLRSFVLTVALGGVAIAAWGLRPVIDRAFPFEEARQAYEYLQSGAHFGKVVIRV